MDYLSCRMYTTSHFYQCRVRDFVYPKFQYGMNIYIKAPQRLVNSAWIVFKYMNIARVTPPIGTKMQSQNEFHLQPNSLKPSLDKGCDTKPLQKEVDHHLGYRFSVLQVTKSWAGPGNEATPGPEWIQTVAEMTFLGLNQPLSFLQCRKCLSSLQNVVRLGWTLELLVMLSQLCTQAFYVPEY